MRIINQAIDSILNFSIITIGEDIISKKTNPAEPIAIANNIKIENCISETLNNDYHLLH